MTGTVVFRSEHGDGPAPAMLRDPRHVRARKRPQSLQVQFAPADATLHTREGPIQVRVGDAIVTGPHGEQWSLPPARFADKYRAVSPETSDDGGLYESLPVQVLALQMDAPFTVELPETGSHLQGGAGDWLIDYGDGSLGIVAQALFGVLYEVIA